MEWLKKHWEIIAASVAGIFLLYWLYKTYQAKAANSAQAAQDASLQNAEQQATANYAQQVALSNLTGGYGGGGGSGTGGGPIQSTQSVAGQNQPVTNSPATSDIGQISGGGYLSVADAIAALPADHQNGDYSFSQNPSVVNNPNTIYAPGSPQAIALGYSSSPVSSAVSTLLGFGGSNDTAPVAVVANVPDLTHVSSGAIPEHGTAIAKTPTNLELASLGGR
jgi:hypothetical protein